MNVYRRINVINLLDENQTSPLMPCKDKMENGDNVTRKIFKGEIKHIKYMS